MTNWGESAVPHQTENLVRTPTGGRGLKVLAGLALMVLAGCFGPPTMRYDIQEYNKQTIASEQKMLLFNLGRLSQYQPPHFTMLATVSQSRTFTGTSGFSWANPATWSVPFMATGTESPTIQFVPIQGQDFANRFESTLTDKFTLFLEDRRWVSSIEEQDEIVTLFAQSLYIMSGDPDTKPDGMCHKGFYLNRRIKPEENRSAVELQSNVGLRALPPVAKAELDGSDYSKFGDCVNEIVTSKTNYQLIDSTYPVPSTAATDPAAADLSTALTAGFEWTKNGDKFELGNPTRIPAWFDYDPIFVAAHKADSQPSDLPPVKIQYRAPSGTELVYSTPKGYSWKSYRIVRGDEKNLGLWALIPDGYDLDRDISGRLRCDAKQQYCMLKKTTDQSPHFAGGLRTAGDPVIHGVSGFVAEDIGSSITGDGVPQGATITDVRLDRGTARMSVPASTGSNSRIIVGDVNEFSYGEDVVKAVWPVAKDFFYVELRRNDKHPVVTDSVAKSVCFGDDDKDTPPNGIVCGFIKIGNLLEIMKRLAELACHSIDPTEIESKCPGSNFGIGKDVPSWADTSASFTDTHSDKEYVWVPAHPQAPLADRDRRAFFNLYKLYQMSLVNTSQLVSGAPSITIPTSTGH
jgi:hypothetical protein